MSNPHQLVKDRTHLQQQRATLDHRESVTTTVRMLRSVVRERSQRRNRDADPVRSDTAILEYLEDLLAVHAGSGPGLSFLAAGLSDFVNQHQGTSKYNRLDPGPNQTPFPAALSAYVSGSGSRSDARDAFAAVLGAADPKRVAAMTWFLDEGLHPIAREGVERTESALRKTREDHITHLRDADKPGSNTDPLEVLGWDAPVAMLPVRLETKFDDATPSGGTLQVRVYPDQLHVDTHEPELTEAEYEWGTAFWAQVWYVNHDMATGSEQPATDVHDGTQAGSDAPPDRLPNDRLRRVVADLQDQIAAGEFSKQPQLRFEEVRDRAWSRGVEQFGTERAAYVIQELSPEHGGSTIGDRLLAGPEAGHWTQDVEDITEFYELPEWAQVWAFLGFETADQDWVLKQLQGNDALDDIEDQQDRIKQLADALHEVTQQRRLELLSRLRAKGKLDRAEHDWLQAVFDDASPVRRPPALRFPADEVAFRPASWTRPPRARLLPDRWVVYAYWDHEGPNATPNLQDPSSDYAQWSTDWQSAGTHAWRRWDPDREQWVKKVTGPAIREPLAVGPRPEEVAGKDRSGDAGMEWMLDFGEAKQAGMGLELSNPDDGSWDGTPGGDGGYDQLVVTGVRTSGDPGRSAAALEDLLAAQEYTQGLSIIRQGTPTNNADEPAGRSSSPDPAASAPVKAGEPLVPVDGVDRDVAVPLSGKELTADGTRLAEALGVATDRFAHVENADTIRHVDAGHANDALWPATWGYYARNLLVPEFWNTVLGGAGGYTARSEAMGWLGATTDEAGGSRLLSGWLAKFRDHFRDHVRGGGPLQTLRVGPQPYGVLPATPLSVDEPATALDANPAVDPVRQEQVSGATAAAGDRPRLRYLDAEALPDAVLLSTLADWVSTLRSTWLRSATGVPRVGDGSMTDQQLLDLLSMEATPRTLRRQSWLLDDTSAVWQLFDSNGTYQPNATGSRRRPTANGGADAVRERNLSHLPALSSPRIASMRFFGQAGLLSDADAIADDSLAGFLRALRGTLDGGLYAPLGTDAPGAEGWLDRLRALGGYWRVGWQSGIRFGSPEQFRSDTPVETARRGGLGPWDDLVRSSDLASTHDWLSTPADLSTSASVLRTVLHFATLREVAATRIRLGALYGDPLEMDPDPATYLDNETIYQELLAELGTGATGSLAAHPAVANGAAGTPTYADAVRAAADADVSPPIDPYLERFGRSLEHLSGMTPEDVEARAMETFGLASHRLDAWWTSIATRQLHNLRTGQVGGSPSDGTLIGAFGHVEDLVPEPAETGEYLLAPSQTQVTTAAVLRSAHRAADDPAHADALAVDLSAERVQRARSLLDGVRNGRSVSAILGHRFEARLRDLTEADDQPNLRQYRGDFRAAAPSKGGPADHRKGSADETVSHSKRSDVVDGRQLLRAWQGGTLWSKPELSDAAAKPAVKAAVDSVLAEFEDWLDAVNDVLTAEAVHQLSTGNPERATAALEGLSRGKQLPPLEVLRTPRQEAGVNNRLMVLFGDAEWRDPATAPALDTKYALRKWTMDCEDIVDPGNLPDLGAPRVQQPPPSKRPSCCTGSKETVGMRHVGEPNLNGWVGELLPQPDRVRCEAAFRWSEDRAFATGTFETPTEPGVVTVTDVGFEPDVVIFRAAHGPSGMTGQPATGGGAHGWTHGVVHDDPEGGFDQRSTSLAAPADGAPEYATSSTAALAVAVPGDGSSAPGIKGAVDATVEDGFQVAFDSVADRSLVVEYQAIKTGDRSAIRVGQFTTDAITSAPATQAVDLDTGETMDSGYTPPPGDSAFDPDHLLVTASNASRKPNRSGAVGSRHHPGSLVGGCHGEAVKTDAGIDQQAVTTALDMAGDDGHAVGFRGDAALELLYGSGDDVSSATTARVTKLGQNASGRPRVELEYQPPSGGASLAGEPAVVTYVAFESPTTEDPVPATHRPAVGYVAAPKDEGDSVTVDPGFDPACLEVVACPGVTAAPGRKSSDDGSPLTVRTTTTGTGGWAHGVATSVANQRGLTEAVRPVVDTSTTPSQYVDETVGIGSTSRLLTVAYLDDEGAVAGRDVGRLTAMDEAGITIEFPDLHSAGGSERPVVLYRAWPTVPEELPHATGAASVPLEALDLSPLDAVSLSQVDARPGRSQLERRLQYHLFRNRPTNHPPVPDDADLELTFTETGTDDDAHVSFAAYLEAARSLRELLGDARPADAEDLAHPSDADGPGYLPAGSPDESKTAAELRDRADEVERRIEAARAIVDNRRALLSVPDDERNVCEQVDAIDDAVEAFCREVPARQIHTVADRLDGVHDATNGPRLLEELRALLGHLRAGPATAGAVDDDVLVEAGTAESVDLETTAPGAELEISARPHSPSEHFQTRTWTRTADGEGTVQITFDATGITAGTRFTVIGRRTSPSMLRPLDPTLEQQLRDVDAETRVQLLERLDDEGRLDAAERDAIDDLLDTARVEEFHELPVDDQVRAFLQLDRADKRAALAALGHEDLAERYPERSLWTVLAAELRELDAGDRHQLLEELIDDGWVTAGERRSINDIMNRVGVSTFANLPADDQLRAFELLDREDKLVALHVLGREEAIGRHALPPLAAVLKRRLQPLSDGERENLFERLREAELVTEATLEAIEDMMDAAGVTEFAQLPPADQLRAFERLDREAKLTVLEELDRGRLVSWYAARAPAEDPALVATGRVLEPVDGGAYDAASLDATVQSQALVPRLLWLHRHVDAIRPADGSVGATLADALDPSTTDWGVIGKEKTLMSTIKPLVPADVFDADDFAAVGRLTDLQHVDLSASTGLTGKLEAAIAPLDRVGLTALVGTTGPKPRPDDQRHWKADDCDVGDIWARHCEGSVRARLRNLLRGPGWPGAPEQFARFAPEFRKLLTGGNLQPEHVFAVETMLKHPAAFAAAMDGSVAEPAALLQDLNELLYHPTELDARVAAGDFRSRLESLRDWLRTGTMPADIEIDSDGVAGLAAYLGGGGVSDLVRFVGRVSGMQPGQHAGRYERRFGDDLAALRGAAGAAGSTQHTLADRIAPAFAKTDLGPPFRRGVLETLRRGLLRASYAGVYGSTPNSTAGGTPEDQGILLDQAEVVVETLGERLDAAQAAASGDPDAVATQVDRLEALLGDEFVVLPPFAPSNPGELAHTFGASDDLLDGDPYAVDTWLQRAARVREHPAGFREALTYADVFDLAGDDATAATGGDRDATIRRSLTVGQLPHDAGTGGGAGVSWVGRDGVRPNGGELSLAALFVDEASGPAPVSATAGQPPIAGLFIDEWVTKVPEAERDLGVGFRYDDPDARAPQSVLLAVPPAWSRGTERPGLQPTAPQTWSMDTIRTTVEETTDLARMRAVDLDALDALGHVLPAACLPHNEASDRVPSTPEVFLPDAPSVLLDTFDWDTLE